MNNIDKATGDLLLDTVYSVPNPTDFQLFSCKAVVGTDINHIVYDIEAKVSARTVEEAKSVLTKVFKRLMLRHKTSYDILWEGSTLPEIITPRVFYINYYAALNIRYRNTGCIFTNYIYNKRSKCNGVDELF